MHPASIRIVSRKGSMQVGVLDREAALPSVPRVLRRVSSHQAQSPRTRCWQSRPLVLLSCCPTGSPSWPRLPGQPRFCSCSKPWPSWPSRRSRPSQFGLQQNGTQRSRARPPGRGRRRTLDREYRSATHRSPEGRSGGKARPSCWWAQSHSRRAGPRSGSASRHALRKRLIALLRHPQPVQQHRQLAGYRHDRSLGAVVAAVLG